MSKEKNKLDAELFEDLNVFSEIVMKELKGTLRD